MRPWQFNLAWVQICGLVFTCFFFWCSLRTLVHKKNGFRIQSLCKRVNVPWLRLSLSHCSKGAAAPSCVHRRCLRLLPGLHSPDRLRLRSRAGLNLRQPEFGFTRQRKTYRRSMHGPAWECCIHKWEAEDRTGSDIWARSPQEWPDWVSRTAPRLALKYLRVQQKKKRVEMMWQIVHLLPGNQTAGSWLFFHARRSSEVILLRVSCVIICWPRSCGRPYGRHKPEEAHRRRDRA